MALIIFRLLFLFFAYGSLQQFSVIGKTVIFSPRNDDMVEQPDTNGIATLLYAPGNVFIFAARFVLTRWMIVSYGNGLSQSFERHFEQQRNIDNCLLNASLR